MATLIKLCFTTDPRAPPRPIQRFFGREVFHVFQAQRLNLRRGRLGKLWINRLCGACGKNGLRKRKVFLERIPVLKPPRTAGILAVIRHANNFAMAPDAARTLRVRVVVVRTQEALRAAERLAVTRHEERELARARELVRRDPNALRHSRFDAPPAFGELRRVVGEDRADEVIREDRPKRAALRVGIEELHLDGRRLAVIAHRAFGARGACLANLRAIEKIANQVAIDRGKHAAHRVRHRPADVADPWRIVAPAIRQRSQPARAKSLA